MRVLEAALDFYAAKLNFRVRHRESRCAIIQRDSAELHLVEVDHEPPRTRDSEICRVEARDIETLYAECQRVGVLHPSELRREWWGDRDFSVVDLDGNQVTFFEPNANEFA